jgi:hypothetical protein
MKITVRNAPDPGGKVVDVFPSSGLLHLVLFVRSPKTTREALRVRVADLLCGAASHDRQFAKRDLPVWFIQVPEGDEVPPLTGLGFPATTATKVLLSLSDPLCELDDFWMVEGGAIEDLDASPLLRYDHGRVIAYGDPMDDPDGCPAGLDELRSTEVPEHKVLRGSVADQGPEVVNANAHSIESWLEASNATEEWVTGLFEPLTYAGLRTLVERRLGIAVHEEPNLAEAGKYGSIRTGWRFGEDTCGVRILLAPQHHNDLKYAILAHEVGHYCRHFPLLHHAQLVEELSWNVPEIEIVFRHLKKSYLTDVGLSLEGDANNFASALLMSPLMLLAIDRSGVFYRGRELGANELIVRGLRSRFPGREQFTAMSTDEMAVAADVDVLKADLASADEGSIYMDMLRACLRRSEGADEASERQLWEAIEDVVVTHTSYLQRWFEESPSVDMTAARAWWGRLLQELQIEPSPPTTNEAHEMGAGGRKVVYHPLGWDGRSLYRTLPLVPASYNLDGSPDGDWLILTDMQQPRGTVNEYLQASRGMGLACYGLESWQRQQLNQIQRSPLSWRSLT